MDCDSLTAKGEVETIIQHGGTAVRPSQGSIASEDEKCALRFELGREPEPVFVLGATLEHVVFGRALVGPVREPEPELGLVLEHEPVHRYGLVPATGTSGSWNLYSGPDPQEEGVDPKHYAPHPTDLEIHHAHWLVDPAQGEQHQLQIGSPIVGGIARDGTSESDPWLGGGT